MGFLDHSTNNVIIDAVLTDRGRELLARNDGSFEITKFALGDDEIDYNLYQKKLPYRSSLKNNTLHYRSTTRHTKIDLVLRPQVEKVTNVSV